MMDKILIVLAALTPFLAYLVWVICWLTSDALRERHRTSTAARGCGDSPRPDHYQDRHRQTPAA